VKILKRFFCIVIAAALVLPLAAQKDPKTLKYPDLEFKPLKPDHVSIGRNFDFYFKENHEAPTITLAIIIRGGSLLDPKDKPGLSQLTYQLLATGGSKTLMPEQVEEQLDFLGSSIYAYSGTEYGQIQLSSLVKNFDKTWEILMNLLLEPRFAPERLDLEKKKEIESILRRWDQPMMVGFTLFQDLVYGKDYPEVQRTTRKGLEAIGDKDIHQFYNDHLRNRAIIIAATGDFSGAKLADKIKTSFFGWKAQAPEKLDIPKAKLAAKPGIYLIDKPDMNQAVIMMGHLGINRLDADIAESNVFNAIYGSGAFNSRLWREVRSNRGLAYSVGSQYSFSTDRGPFAARCQTGIGTAGEATALIRDALKAMTEKPPSEEEVALAKESLINVFVFSYQNAGRIVYQSGAQDFYGFPKDYMATYPDRIRKITADDCLKVAQEYLHPEKMVYFVLGPAQKLKEPMQTFGPVEVKPLPEP